MNLTDVFRRSAKELKSVRCLAVTGILVAMYVILNSYFAYNTEILKITFGYLALATIGMFYGPVVAVVAAIPCDIVTAMLGSLGINLFFTFPKILEGLIYGMLLYGYASRGPSNKKGAGWATWQVMRIVIARLLVMGFVYLILNSYLTLVLYSPATAEGKSFWVWAWGRSGVKNVAQFPIDLTLMFMLLPSIMTLYNKVGMRFSKERIVKT